MAVLSSPIAGTAPTVAEARLASSAAAEMGAVKVMLFGSVARGEARPGSDIDLVVVFPDLGDYSERSRLRSEVNAAGCAAAGGREVNAHVTDVAEWAKRSVEVTASFEHSLNGDLIVLHEDPDPQPPPDMGKEIQLPSDNLREAETRFRDVVNSVEDVAARLSPPRGEASQGEGARLDRMRQLCGAAGRTVECAVKTLTVLGGSSPATAHWLPLLLAEMPDQALAERVAAEITGDGAISLEEASRWHVKSNYADDVKVQWAEADEQKTAMVQAAARCALTARDSYAAAGGAGAELLQRLHKALRRIRAKAPAVGADTGWMTPRLRKRRPDRAQASAFKETDTPPAANEFE